MKTVCIYLIISWTTFSFTWYIPQVINYSKCYKMAKLQKVISVSVCKFCALLSRPESNAKKACMAHFICCEKFAIFIAILARGEAFSFWFPSICNFVLRFDKNLIGFDNGAMHHITQIFHLNDQSNIVQYAPLFNRGLDPLGLFTSMHRAYSIEHYA